MNEKLKKRSEAYADFKLQQYNFKTIKYAVKALVDEAYKQGWIDRGHEEFNNEIKKPQLDRPGQR